MWIGLVCKPPLATNDIHPPLYPHTHNTIIPSIPPQSKHPRHSWLRWPPEWVEHLRILRVLDSDTVFLHGQERELRLLAGG